MKLRIHVCNNDQDADKVIEGLNARPNFRALNLRKIDDYHLVINDHCGSIDSPDLKNLGKVCVVYES